MVPAPATSDRVSHYLLLERIGQGAMGEVWLAQDTQLPRKVAVKLLPRGLAADAEAAERLLREAQAAASVDHPAVVTVYEAGIAEGRPYLVMQHVEGETLAQRLERGPLAIGEATELAKRIADALAEVHALGIVHRDLKPANIVLTPRGPKVLDFGVASMRGLPQLTAAGAAVGTPLTMSPEQLKGLPPDNRSDLWAMGVILYECLTGRSPFAGPSFEVVASQVLGSDPPPPSRLRAEIGPDLDFMVMKLLRKDPARRYARAEELVADLESCEACVAGSSGPPALGERPIPRLAVLPLEVMSADADDAFLAAGLVEDLIVDLTRLGGLQVASRAEVATYRDRIVPPRTLARELGVDFVLTGSVRRAGNRARISTQLVRAQDGHALWAERFDRTLEDLFEVQAEVSKRIVDALQIALRPGEREMLSRAPTRSTEAYGLYLRAREMLDTGRQDNLRAGALLEQALALDSDFALAQAALGECYAQRGMRWWAGREVADRAMEHAERALELEPDLLEAHLVRAMAYRIRGEGGRMLETLEKVMAMAPEHPAALEWSAWSYMSIGRPERALGILERLVERHPDRFVARGYVADCLEMMGRESEWRAARRLVLDSTIEFLRRHPDDPLARVFLAVGLVREGEIDAGLAQADRAIALSPEDGRIRYNAACVFARAGKAERAIAELKAGIGNLGGYLTDWPRRDPDLASLRAHPEFVAMFGAEPRP